MTQSQKPLILIVDDEPTNITVLAEALSADYTIRTALSGERALTLVEQPPLPDLILLDISMSGLDGYQVCQQLKKMPATTHIPIIFITIRDSEHDEAYGLSLGATDYIVKPFILPIIQARIKTQLKIKTQTDELRLLHANAVQKQTLFRAVADLASEMIYYRSPEGHYLYINPYCETLTGYAPTAFYNTPHFLDSLVYPEDLAHWQTHQTTYPQQSTRPTPLEMRLFHCDGSVRWVQHTMIPVTDSETQALLGFRASCVDITERHQFIAELKQARHVAEEASQAKSRFLANITHELRTPLNTVIGYSDLLFEELHDHAYLELTEYVRHIQSAGTHLLNLVNDVLELSHIETGQLQIYFSIFQPHLVLNDIMQMVNFISQKNKNELNLVIDNNGLGEMYSDLVKVRQIIFNLMNNACKFTHNGSISLRAWREHQAARDWLVFEVQDTGIGMTQNQKKQLFRPFTQGDESSTRRYGGTGLGLCLTRYFTQMLGGTLDVQSEYNIGSTFTVKLPAISTEGHGEIALRPFESHSNEI